MTADLAVGSNRDLRLMVARGDIAGAYPFGAYGERTTASGETNRVIWPNGTFALPNSAGVQMSIVSTSANDTAAGTGARTIEMHYLDANLAEQAEIITMDGLTPVLTTATDIVFINDFHVITYGTAPAAAAGNITAKNAGSTYSQISTGAVRCSSSARMIPAGKVCFVAGAVGGAASGTAAASSVIRVVASELDGDQYVYPLIMFPFGSIAVQDSSATYTFQLPLKFQAGTVVALNHTTDKGATITGSWFGWLESI